MVPPNCSILRRGHCWPLSVASDAASHLPSPTCAFPCHPLCSVLVMEKPQTRWARLSLLFCCLRMAVNRPSSKGRNEGISHSYLLEPCPGSPFPWKAVLHIFQLSSRISIPGPWEAQVGLETEVSFPVAFPDMVIPAWGCQRGAFIFTSSESLCSPNSISSYIGTACSG